jgi:hypothetical protein
MGWLGDPDRPTARNGTRAHCRDCHAIWKRATQMIHCVRCHLTFAAPGVLEDHQPVGVCIAPETVGHIGVENEWGTIVYRRVRDEIML